VYDAYRRAPEVTRRRMYLETMQRVLPQIGSKVFMDRALGSVIPIVPMEGLKALLGESAPKPGGER